MHGTLIWLGMLLYHQKRLRRRISSKSQPKANSRKYWVENKRACKQAFLLTYRIGSSQLHWLLKKKIVEEVTEKNVWG